MDNRYYIGSTENLEMRLKAHNRGSVKSTKNRNIIFLKILFVAFFLLACNQPEEKLNQDKKEVVVPKKEEIEPEKLDSGTIINNIYSNKYY